jgi:hypothetical protein
VIDPPAAEKTGYQIVQFSGGTWANQMIPVPRNSESVCVYWKRAELSESFHTEFWIPGRRLTDSFQRCRVWQIKGQEKQIENFS